MKKTLFLVITILVTPSIALAHGGGLDATGGHTCRTNCALYGFENGEYHGLEEHDRQDDIETAQAIIASAMIAVREVEYELEDLVRERDEEIASLTSSYNASYSSIVNLGAKTGTTFGSGDLTSGGRLSILTANYEVQIDLVNQRYSNNKNFLQLKLTREVEFIANQQAKLAQLLKEKEDARQVREMQESVVETTTEVVTVKQEATPDIVSASSPVVSDTSSTKALYRFYSPTYKGHFYTTSIPEKQTLQFSDDNWEYEGEAYNVEADISDINRPIYRFYSDVFKGHFYTISEDEKTNLINSDPNWSFEGVAYYAHTTGGADMKPIYRFWSDMYKHHFYTTSFQEKESLVANDPNWSYEGIAWYVK